MHYLTEQTLPSPRSVYIHVPFCNHRCGYCNFTLVSGRDDLVPAFLQSLELEVSRTIAQPQLMETVFVGGGTPSHLSPTHLSQLFKIIAHWFPLAMNGEFSCEVNPLDCDNARLDVLNSSGVNRISLGGQSFNAKKLQKLERDHTGEQLFEAIKRCQAGFTNVSVDLIFAAPGETFAQWQQDLETTLACSIQHLSTYGLTIERGSAFYGRALKADLKELDSDLQLQMYEHTIDRLVTIGWQHYEVSNFAQDGFRCRHNEAYWLGKPWLAFGPGAASFAPNKESDQPSRFVRTVNHRSTTTYIRKVLAGQSAVAESDELSLENYVRERLVFGLRRLEGVAMSELDQIWQGSAIRLFEPFLDDYSRNGWLEQVNNCWRLTRRGLVISDSLWPNLLAD